MGSDARLGAFTDVYTSSGEIPAPVGTINENEYGDRYMLVKNVGSSSTVVGKLACWDTGGARGEVSMTVGDVATPALSTTSRAAGVFVSIIVQNGWGWMQISGRATVYTDDGASITALNMPFDINSSSWVKFFNEREYSFVSTIGTSCFVEDVKFLQ